MNANDLSACELLFEQLPMHHQAMAEELMELLKLCELGEIELILRAALHTAREVFYLIKDEEVGDGEENTAVQS
jgi:hypothetical protein